MYPYCFPESASLGCGSGRFGVGVGVWCCSVSGVWCLVFGDWCLVFGVWGLVFGVWCLGCGGQGLEVRDWNLGDVVHRTTYGKSRASVQQKGRFSGRHQSELPTSRLYIPFPGTNPARFT